MNLAKSNKLPFYLGSKTKKNLISKLRLQMIPAIVLKFLLLSIAYAYSQVIEIVQNSADKLRDRHLACIFEVYVTFVSYYMACNVPSMYQVTCVGRKLVYQVFLCYAYHSQKLKGTKDVRTVVLLYCVWYFVELGIFFPGVAGYLLCYHAL